MRKVRGNIQEERRRVKVRIADRRCLYRMLRRLLMLT